MPQGNNRREPVAATEMTNERGNGKTRRQYKQQDQQPRQKEPRQQSQPKQQPRNRYRKRQKVDGFDYNKCIQWFKQYTTEDDPDTLGPDGMEQFCDDIGVKPDNVLMLVLAFKMGAAQMCFFTKSEWTKGFTDLQCDAASKFQSKLQLLKDCLNDSDTFNDICKYAFDFAKEDKNQRYLDVKTAKMMLHLLLEKDWSLYPQFIEFLDKSSCKTINRDQWRHIFKFSNSINADLSNYDINEGSWPLLLDDFVSWLDPKHGEEAMRSK